MSQPLNFNQLAEFGGMLPREILKLRASEVARKCIFLFIFEFPKLSKRATKLLEKVTFPQSLRSGGGTFSMVPTSMLVATAERYSPLIFPGY